MGGPDEEGGKVDGPWTAWTKRRSNWCLRAQMWSLLSLRVSLAQLGLSCSISPPSEVVLLDKEA